MAALWSSSLSDILSFPIEQLTLFLLNHKMLQIFHRPKWLTVKDRSKTYVDAVQVSGATAKALYHLPTQLTTFCSSLRSSPHPYSKPLSRFASPILEIPDLQLHLHTNVYAHHQGPAFPLKSFSVGSDLKLQIPRILRRRRVRLPPPHRGIHAREQPGR